MSAYIPSLTSLVSTTTSRYTSALRQRITTTSSENDDLYIDDPDSSHVSRVLRAYYKEKQKPLPAWLGVDPRDREKAQETGGGGGGGYLGSLRRSAAAASGAMSQGASTPSRRPGGGLGEIWGEGEQQQQQQQQQEGSLRRTPGAGAGLGAERIAARKAVGSGNQEPTGGPIGGARPLPSQRAGSYQSMGGGGGGGGGSAQDRLRARLASRLGSGSSGGSGDEAGGRRY
ncbi:MAG: hypothetical protein Q9166_001468 [cf. Caloplaca sp. 2 TL-2023]